MFEFIVGGLAATNAITLLALGFQYDTFRRALKAALRHETQLLDRARAADARADIRVADLLARISTEPRLELAPGARGPRPDPEARKYIADDVQGDVEWNDYTGEPDEETD